MPDDLYFIRADRGPVKIGRSNNVARRFATLRLMSPVPLEIVGVIAEAGEDEAAWHICFADHRSHGEWFRWSDALARAIGIALQDGDWRSELSRNVEAFTRPARLPRPQIAKVSRSRIIPFSERRRARSAQPLPPNTSGE